MFVGGHNKKRDGLSAPMLLRQLSTQLPTLFEPAVQQPVSVVHALGLQLLHDPW
jgi:hypothetical protein